VEPKISTPGDRRMDESPSLGTLDGPPSRFQGVASSSEQPTKNSCISREYPPSNCRLVQVEGGGCMVEVEGEDGSKDWSWPMRSTTKVRRNNHRTQRGYWIRARHPRRQRRRRREKSMRSLMMLVGTITKVPPLEPTRSAQGEPRNRGSILHRLRLGQPWE
jgi:hypothetical protein